MNLTEKEKASLKKVYYNTRNPAAFSGLTKFYKSLKSKNIKISHAKVKKWLSSQDAYTLHKGNVNKFKKNKTMSYKVDWLWQCDLADMSNISRQNNGVKFLLVCIDVLSRFLFIRPLKNKTAEAVNKAFFDIFQKSGRKPKKIHSDGGNYNY